ncbi:HAD family hydrolase [Streptomyces boluensis]|uniref:HAD family hydrolase n=1 Tax=Streptomyces boluensis TaxID=1775135 RepID=UPI0028AA05F1|nr:HAD hydrolase-like protein [Streptomyces boluensis]
MTGNVRAVAATKLRVFALDSRIEWEAGAYGEDADVRPDLVALALRRSATMAADAVLIGDTPADVEGGRSHGVQVIAVDTGRSSTEALRDAGADIVLDDLTDTERLVKLVTSHR